MRELLRIPNSSSRPAEKPGRLRLRASPTSSTVCSPRQTMGRDGSVRNVRECSAPREACVPTPGFTPGRGRISASTVSGRSVRLRRYEATRGFTRGRNHTSVNIVGVRSHNRPVSVPISRHTGTTHRRLHILLLCFCYYLFWWL